MTVSNYTKSNITLESWVWFNDKDATVNASAIAQPACVATSFDVLQPVRQWLDQVDVRDRKLAKRLCELIPAQCPFERDVKLFGRTLFHIPPMCKLNPLYEQVVGLRFRALCYLADECGEDVTAYC
ncbi:MAG TPA: Mo-dependent nitrogenase C-terminal domain-containing protein [Oculatellaceae cyanobacterium]|jgi:hypothetical protein